MVNSTTSKRGKALKPAKAKMASSAYVTKLEMRDEAEVHAASSTLRSSSLEEMKIKYARYAKAV